MTRLSDSARALLAAASIFLTGTVVGVSFDRLVLIQADAHAAAATPRSVMHRDHDEVLGELAAEVGLTPAQSVRVREILAERQAEIDRIWAAVHSDIRGTTNDVTLEVERVLDDEQVQRLHAWLERYHGAGSGHSSGDLH
jgi:hypothetical protein